MTEPAKKRKLSEPAEISRAKAWAIIIAAFGGLLVQVLQVWYQSNVNDDVQLKDQSIYTSTFPRMLDHENRITRVETFLEMEFGIDEEVLEILIEERLTEEVEPPPMSEPVVDPVESRPLSSLMKHARGLWQ